MTIERYTEFLGGVASVSGVFLGLYFTAISIGVGQKLSDMSPRVRRLIVNERRGRLYIRLLTTLTSLSFLFWADAACFGEISYPAFSVVVSFSLIVVSTFYTLGVESFFLADPASVAAPLIWSIHNKLDQLRSPLSESAKPSFERHLRLEVTQLLSTLSEVLDLGLLKSRQDASQIAAILSSLLWQVNRYQSLKRHVTVQSLWFAQTAEHKDLLLLGDFGSTMLEDYRQIPNPEFKAHTTWFENAVIQMLERALKFYADKNDVAGLLQLMPVLREACGQLANKWEIEVALKIRDVVLQSVEQVQPTDLNFDDRLVLLESGDVLQVDIIQQCLQKVIKHDVKSEVEYFTDVVLKNRGQENTFLILPEVKVIMEELTEKVAFEKRIEGSVLTPRWYVSQHIARAYAIEVRRIYGSLCGLPVIKAVDANMSSRKEATLTQFSTQYSMQAASHIRDQHIHYDKFIHELKSFERVSDIPIESLDATQSNKQLESVISRGHDVFAELIIKLYESERDRSYPDFFGMAFHQLIHELFRALAANDKSRFRQLYPPVVIASQSAFQRLNNELKTSDDQTRMRFAMEPTLDVLDLGVYAALFGEIHSNPELPRFVVATWDRWFKALPVEAKSLERLIAIYNLKKVDFRIVQRSAHRYKWERAFLDEVEHHFGPVMRRSIYGEVEFDRNALPILRELVSGDLNLHHDLTEVFLALYLEELGASQGVLESFDSISGGQLRRALKGDQS